MNRAFVWMAGFLLAAATALPAVSVRAQGDGDPARGARYYADNCGRCHNPRSPNQLRDRDWEVSMRHMRITAALPAQQARDIAAFLMAANNPPRIEPMSRAPHPLAQTGRQLIDQYACNGCHVIAGKGGAVGPALDGIGARRDLGYIEDQVMNPRGHNPASTMPNFGLSRDQARAIAEALAALPAR